MYTPSCTWREVVVCNLYLYYYEKENIFVDEEGEVIFDLFRAITPSDLFLFRNILDDYENFPMVDHPEVTVRIISIPKEPVCGRLHIPALDLQKCFEQYEQYERFGHIICHGT